MNRDTNLCTLCRHNIAQRCTVNGAEAHRLARGELVRICQQFEGRDGMTSAQEARGDKPRRG